MTEVHGILCNQKSKALHALRATEEPSTPDLKKCKFSTYIDVNAYKI